MENYIINFWLNIWSTHGEPAILFLFTRYQNILHIRIIGLMTGVGESNPHFFANFLCILLLIDTMNACPVCRIHFKSVAQHVAQASFCRDILTKGNIGNRYPTRSSYSATIQGNTNHPHESQDDPFLDVDLHTYPEDDSMGNNVASAVGQTDERIADDLDQYNQTTCEPLPLVTAADVEQIPTKYFSGNFVLTPQTRGYIEVLYFADKYAIPKCGWEELCSLLNKLHCPILAMVPVR
jgi:hypothetical protein